MLAEIRKQLYIAMAALRRVYLRSVWGMTIGKGTRISGKAFLDFTNPKGVHIGDYSIITPGARILTHDYVGARHGETHIGSCCFIGANAIIMPGVRIGDHCIIAAGSVVTGHVPDRTQVAGNPARILKTGINTGHYGRTVEWAEGRLADDQIGEISHGIESLKPLDGPQQTPTEE